MRGIWFVSLIAIGLTMLSGQALAASQPEATAPDAHMQQGAQAFQHGMFDEALSHWKTAAQAYQRAEQKKEQAMALVEAARAAQALGQLREATALLQAAQPAAEQSSDPLSPAFVLAGLARAESAGGILDRAAEHFDQALAVARRYGSPGLAASILNEVGILRINQKRDQDALTTFSESASLAQTAALHALAVRAGTNAARAALKLGRIDEARQWTERAFDQRRNLASSHETASVLITTGLLYRDLGLAQEQLRDPLLLKALQILQEAASVAESLGDGRTASYALGHAGHLYEMEHRYEDALSLTRRAIFAAQSASAPEALYRWEWQAGRLLAATGKLDEAIAAYRTAAATLQPIRPEVAASGHLADASAGEPTKPLFFELSNLLLQRAALTDDGKIAEDYLRGARDAVEAFKAAELRDYFKDECVDALRARLTKLDVLANTTAVIYPIIFPDRTELLVSLPSGLKRVSVDVTATRLTQEIRSFRRKLETRTTREYLLYAQQLYDWMLRPLEQDLATHKIDTLVFVPDGPLRTIPMAALHDGKQFLIKKFAVAMTPGLNLTDPRPLDRERIKLLASGLTEATQGFPPLPHVKREIQTIHTLYGGGQLLNKDFVISGLEKELREQPISVLHIASHGRFEKDVAHSFVLTYDTKLTVERLDQYIGLFKFRQEPLELLILSACETAVGDDRAALGLAGVAIKAGARSALATLWSINDQASSDLVAEFYRQLRESDVSKAVALQRAQVKMLSDLAYEHPAYWSPFLLLNNWL